MPRLSPCPSCRVHVLVDDRECPHCGATLRTTGASRVAVVAMGLTLAGCPDPAPLYGATDSFDDDTTDSTETASTASTAGTSITTGISTTGETDAMTGTTTAGSSTGMADSTSGGTGDTDATTGSTSVGEPDYGVPESSS